MDGDCQSRNVFFLYRLESESKSYLRSLCMWRINRSPKQYGDITAMRSLTTTFRSSAMYRCSDGYATFHSRTGAVDVLDMPWLPKKAGLILFWFKRPQCRNTCVWTHHPWISSQSMQRNSIFQNIVLVMYFRCLPHREMNFAPEKPVSLHWW